MRHIPGILSIPDGLIKALSWVLHPHRAHPMMVTSSTRFLGGSGKSSPPASFLVLCALRLIIFILSCPYGNWGRCQPTSTLVPGNTAQALCEAHGQTIWWNNFKQYLIEKANRIISLFF